MAVKTKKDARLIFKRSLKMLGRARPFTRGLVSQCRPAFVKTKKEKEKVPTACVMLRPNRKFKMYFNPDFVVTLETEHLCGIMNHEINHMMRGHLTLERTGLDEEVLTLALEVHANMDIPKSWLPPQTKDGEALTHEHFNIPLDIRSWKKIYTKLLKKFGNKKRRNNQQKKEMKETNVKKVMSDNATGHSKKSPRIKGKVSKKLKKRLRDSQEVKSILATLINKVWKKRVEDQEREDDEDLNSDTMVEVELEILKEATDHIPGLSAGMLKMLRIKTETKIKWEQHLSNFVVSIKKRSSSYQKINKRFPDLLGIVPGRDSRMGKSNIIAFIDTSGSCADWASRFLNEVEKLGRYCNGVVCEWDTAEEAVYKIGDAPKRNNVYGGGGTNFNGCLNDEYLKQLAKRFGMRKIDGVVFLTDLYVTLPKKGPRIPLIWFCIPGGRFNNVPFGKLIRIEK